MNNKRYFVRAGLVGFTLGAVFLGTLTGCVGYIQGPGANVYVAPAPVVVEQDDYVYYPQYEMYYGSNSHQWYYQNGGSWQARPAPRDVSVNVVLASPSVNMSFHDSPAAHHSQVVQKYPKNWKSSGGNQDHQGHQN